MGRSDLISLSPIRVIHPKVDFADIQSNGKLLSDEQIASIKKELHGKNGRFTKKQASSPYPIIVSGNSYFAIYKGVKSKRHLGSGAYGYVKLVQDLDSGDFYALKAQSKRVEKHFLQEVDILNRLGLVVKDVNGALVKYDWEPQKKIARHNKLKRSNMLHVLLRLENGIQLDELIDQHQRRKSIGVHKPAIVKYLNLMLDILKQIKAMHQEKGILHGDIKLENILCNPDMTASLIDWGFAGVVGSDGSLEGPLQGTPKYLAPEVCQQYLDQNPACLLVTPANQSAIEETIKFMLEQGFISISRKTLEMLCEKYPKEASRKHFDHLVRRLIDSKLIKEESSTAVASSSIDESKSTIISYTIKDHIYALGIMFGELVGLLRMSDESIRLDRNLIDDLDAWRVNAHRDTRRRVYSLVDSMISIDPMKRPSLEQMIGSIEGIIEKAKNEDKAVSAVCIQAAQLDLYLSEINYDLDKDHEGLVSSLRHYDEVYLLDDGVSGVALTRAHAFLRSAKIPVMDEVIINVREDQNKVVISDFLSALHPEYEYGLLDLLRIDASSESEEKYPSDISNAESDSESGPHTHGSHDDSLDEGNSFSSDLMQGSSHSQDSSHSQGSSFDMDFVSGNLHEEFQRFGFFTQKNKDVPHDETKPDVTPDNNVKKKS